MKTIVARPEDIQTHQSLTQVLQLQDLCVVGQEYDEIKNVLIILCVPRWPMVVCPTCGQVCQHIHDYPKQRSIHDTPLRGRPTLLVFDSRRFHCEQCQQPFTEPIRDVVPECTYTYRLMTEISDPRRKQDVSTLAEIYGLGYKLVEGIILKAADLKLSERLQAPVVVESLGIDEIANRKGHGDYVLVLTDLKRRVLVDILPDRQKQSLIKWLQQPPPGIDLSELQQAATDLWAHYREAVQAVYPQVSIIADRFHVMQNLNEAIHQTRRKFQAQASSEDERTHLKGLRYLLIKNQAKLKPAEQERLAQLQRTHPTLYQLCQLRQAFHDFYETHTDPDTAHLSLLKWIEQAQALELQPINQFCKTLTNWHQEIVNFFPSSGYQRLR